MIESCLGPVTPEPCAPQDPPAPPVRRHSQADDDSPPDRRGLHIVRSIWKGGLTLAAGRFKTAWLQLGLQLGPAGVPKDFARSIGSDGCQVGSH